MTTLRNVLLPLGAVAATVMFVSCATAPTTGPMGFFVTSAVPAMAAISAAWRVPTPIASRWQAAGSGNRTLARLLERRRPPGTAAVHARDRIGAGPWLDVKGVVIASDVAELHGGNNLNKQTALTEKGAVVNGRGDSRNMHDILTGSRPTARRPVVPGRPT